jgi:hypothetical protein
MTSQFFYLPADKKVDDEVRIKFTQGRIKMVKDWLQEKIVNKFTENEFTPKIFLDSFGERRKIVSIKIVTDKDCNITKKYNIDYNYYNSVVDEFCANNRCKIDKKDLEWLLMLTFRDNGIEVSPMKGTLNISL